MPSQMSSDKDSSTDRTPPDLDSEQSLIEQVRDARTSGTPLLIRGGASKAFYGNPTPAGQVLDCSTHRGVIAYEPTELAITLRAGTPLAALQALLAEHGQQLPFEPPHFGGTATIGGAVAAGLSGPRRPYAGSCRDAVLGVRLLNGRGQALAFGGRVMKNVAGYDVSRLLVGSLGVLAVLLEVSIKVAPMPVACMTLVQESAPADALATMRRWARRGLPIGATAWDSGRLYVRVHGGDAVLVRTRAQLGGEPLVDADAFWADLREQRLAFFAGDEPLWRLSVAPATPLDQLATESTEDPWLLEWGGALRWLRSHRPAADLRALARGAGGHATLFRPGAEGLPSDGVFAPLSPIQMRLHRNLKRGFDPDGLFNPGRLYPEL